MKIQAHCFAEDASITPATMNFEYKGYDASVISIEEKLMLQISKVLTDEELHPFYEKFTSSEESSEVVEEKLDFRLEPYKIVLTEVGHLLEGLFSLFYASIPPHFETSRININLYGQTEEEKKMLIEGTIVRGGGYVLRSDKKSYVIDDSIYKFITPSLDHIPAFSFFSNALRSIRNNDSEVAFFLFFRILDGYFSFGATAVLKELLKKEVELRKFIPYEAKFINSLKRILSEMGLSSKSDNDFRGLITDIVLIRHKLTHFSSTKAMTHHSSVIKLELMTVNSYLYLCCFNLLREKIAT